MTRAALGERDYLHRDPAERAGDRADQNDRREERAQEADHGVEDLSSAEGRAVQRDGQTIIPVRLYLNEAGKAKIEIAMAKGKKLHDKREASAERDWQRDKARLLRDKG